MRARWRWPWSLLAALQLQWPLRVGPDPATEVYALRRALADACGQCPPCGGDGSLRTPGGALILCRRCLPWRHVLARQER